MGNVTSLTKINGKVSSSLKTFTKVLRKQEATCKELATKLDSLNENIVNSSERFADQMDAALTRIGDQFKQQPSPTPLQNDSFDIESTVRRRNLLTEKIVRSELLSEYFQHLLDEPTPFAPREHRTKVQKNTPERDLKHRRKQTINTVNTEIALMQDRIADWQEQNRVLDAQINDYCTTHEDQRDEILTRVNTHYAKYKDTYSNNNMAKRKEEDEEEKKSDFDFLLSIVDEEEAPSSKNERGRNQTKRGRRPPRM